MKLYIPTCTVNLNNILSTESISPPVFYQKRKFGNKRFEKVEAGNWDNFIVLYSKIPFFGIKDEGLDNFWMVLEVETETFQAQLENVRQAKIEGVEVYICQSTIYLNPFTTFFYFDNDSVISLVASKAEQSLENKLFALYRRLGCFLPKPKEAEKSFQWEGQCTATPITGPLNAPCEKEIENDRILDRVKGFVYCYLIGANSSSSKETSELKLLAHKMGNTLSAIVNSPERRPTVAQDEALLSLVKRFGELYQTLDDVWLRNNIIIDQKFERTPFKQKGRLSREEILDGLELLEIKGHFLRTCCLESAFDVQNDVYAYVKRHAGGNFERFNDVLEKLSRAVAKVESHENAKSKFTPINALFRFSSGGIEAIEDKKFPLNFYIDFVNYLIKTEYVREMSKTQKNISITLHCGKLMKEEISRETEWEGSPCQSYLNGLLDNLEHFAKFDINSTENAELKHLAAFAQKGADIDRLSDYLLQCGFSDYRLAYGLYGASEGFATLPKTFTGSFFDSGDTDYVFSVYKDIYGQCFGKSLEPWPVSKKEIKIPDLVEPGADGVNRIIDYLRQNMEGFKEEYIENLKMIFSAIYSGKIDKIFLKNAENKKHQYPRGSKEKCIKCLKRYIKENMAQKDGPQKLTLIPSYDSARHVGFYNDKEAAIRINDILTDLHASPEDREKIQENLKYFQNGYLPEGAYSDEKKFPRDNFKVVDGFGRLCSSPNLPEKYRVETADLLDNIIKKLHEIYR